MRNKFVNLELGKFFKIFTLGLSVFMIGLILFNTDFELQETYAAPTCPSGYDLNNNVNTGGYHCCYNPNNVAKFYDYDTGSNLFADESDGWCVRVATKNNGGEKCLAHEKEAKSGHGNLICYTNEYQTPVSFNVGNNGQLQFKNNGVFENVPSGSKIFSGSFNYGDYRAEKAQYVFRGWTTEVSESIFSKNSKYSSNCKYYGTETISIYNSLTMYACFEPILTFDIGTDAKMMITHEDGSWGYELPENYANGKFQVNMGSGVDLSRYKAERENYKFTGWFYSNGYSAGVGEYWLAGPITLYAGWEKEGSDSSDNPSNDYFVILNPNGGTWNDGSTSEKKIDYTGSYYFSNINSTLSKGDNQYVCGWTLDGTSIERYVYVDYEENGKTLIAKWCEKETEPTLPDVPDGSCYVCVNNFDKYVWSDSRPISGSNGCTGGENIWSFVPSITDEVTCLAKNDEVSTVTEEGCYVCVNGFDKYLWSDEIPRNGSNGCTGGENIWSFVPGIKDEKTCNAKNDDIDDTTSDEDTDTDKDDDDIDSNPGTGSLLLYFVYLVGVVAFGYTGYYAYKTIKLKND